MDIKSELDRLADMQAQRQVIALQKQELIDKVNAEKQVRIDEILTDEIKSLVRSIETDAAWKITDIEAEFCGKYEAVDLNISVLTDDIKAAVKEHGATVKGTYLQAVYSKGRTTWMTDKLEGLALAFPPLLEAKKVGEPSVSFRDVK
jgi:hypothetical protein